MSPATRRMLPPAIFCFLTGQPGGSSRRLLPPGLPRRPLPAVYREWNRGRPEAERWEEPVLRDLASRFERPDSRNRWEAPLFTLRTALGEQALACGLAEVAAALGLDGRQGAVAAAAATEQRKVEELRPNLATHVNCHALSGGRRAGPGRGEAGWGGAGRGGAVPRRRSFLSMPMCVSLTPTPVAMFAATNLQYEIDRAAQAVLERIAEAQAAAGAASPGLVTFPPPGSSGDGTRGSHGASQPASQQQQQQQNGSNGANAAQQPAKPLSLDVCRPLLLPELRRHKRTFMKARRALQILRHELPALRVKLTRTNC